MPSHSSQASNIMVTCPSTMMTGGQLPPRMSSVMMHQSARKEIEWVAVTCPLPGAKVPDWLLSVFMEWVSEWYFQAEVLMWKPGMLVLSHEVGGTY